MSRPAVGIDGSTRLALVLTLGAVMALLCAWLLISADNETAAAPVPLSGPALGAQATPARDAQQRRQVVQPLERSGGQAELLSTQVDPASSNAGGLLAVQLEGRVTDDAGLPMAGARIELVLGGALHERIVASDAEGRFRIAAAVRWNAAVTLAVSLQGYGPHVSRRRFTTSGLHDLGNLVLSGGGELRGLVLDADGWPVPDAELRLTSLSSVSAALTTELAARACARVTTGSDGAFVIAHLPPGGYRLRATAAQFCWSEYGDPIAIRAGEPVDIGVIELLPGVTLVGHVFDLDGRAVPQARVSLLSRADHVGVAVSDEHGRFELAHIPSAPVRLKLESERHLTWVGEFPEQDLGAVQITLGDPLVLALDVIALATGRPLSAYAARPRRVGELDSPAPVVGTHGAYQDVAGDIVERLGGATLFAIDQEGWWVVDVLAPGYVSTTSEPLLISAAADRAELQLLLEDSLPVAGRVTAARDGLPVAAVAVVLWSLGRDDVDRTLLARTRTDFEGAFGFDGVGAGRCLIEVRSSDHALLVTQPFEPMALRRGLELELLALAGLQGRVRSRDTAADQCMVVVLPAGPGSVGAVGLSVVPVAADGTYLAPDLQPGAYVLRAFTGETRLFVDQLIKNAPMADLFLQAGEQRRFDLTLTPSGFGSLVGSVLANGQPALGFAVSLQPPVSGGGSQRLLSRVDHLGHFEIVEVPSGSYRVMIYSEGEGLLLHETTLAISRDNRSELAFDLPTGRVSGRIMSRYGDTMSALEGQLRLGPGLGWYPGTPGAEDTSARRPIAGGRFSARHLPAGLTRLELLIEGREARSIEVRVVANQDNVVEVLDQPPDGS